MKRLALACLALLMVCAAASSTAGAQENNGNHYGWRNRYNGQCNSQYGRQHRDRRQNGDNDNDNDRDDNGSYGQYGQNGQYGQYGQYGQNGQYNNCAGQYNGQYSGNSVVRGQIVAVDRNMVTISTNSNYNNGGYGSYGAYGQTITINDQPALDNQASGRVNVGRYVTAHGYWQNGVFYATRMN
jgi:hypothetical protein